MLIKLLLPPLYLFIGWWSCTKSPYDFKHLAALLVNKIIIPIVIIYNLATYQTGMAFVIISMMVMMALMLWVGGIIKLEAIERLCLGYLNIAWFGLPVAGAIMGDSATKLLITLYIGNSLFGNSVSAGLLHTNQPPLQRVYKILLSPSFIALVIGLSLIPFQTYVLWYTSELYQICKGIMGFLGMFILGGWLAGVQLDRQGFSQALRPFLIRTLGFLILVFIFIQIAKLAGITLVTDNQPALYLLALLPPAANIIVLETFYLKTGHSAKPIAYGTCFSIVLIGIYVSGLVLLGIVK